jgi:hypothetical protein
MGLLSSLRKLLMNRRPQQVDPDIQEIQDDANKRSIRYYALKNRDDRVLQLLNQELQLLRESEVERKRIDG